MFYCDFHIARIRSIRSLKMLCGIYKKIDINTGRTATLHVGNFGKRKLNVSGTRFFLDKYRRIVVKLTLKFGQFAQSASIARGRERLSRIRSRSSRSARLALRNPRRLERRRQSTCSVGNRDSALQLHRVYFFSFDKATGNLMQIG